MIGLCRGLAARVYLDSGWKREQVEAAILTTQWFGIMTRQQLATYPDFYFPRTKRYYELLDACPLRMGNR